MKSAFTKKEIEMLSAYVDGTLSSHEKSVLEKRLSENSALRTLLTDFQWQKKALNSQPKLRAPRNFTLTPAMVGVSSEQTYSQRKFSVFGFVSALAVMIFAIVLTADFMSGGIGLGRSFLRERPLNALMAESAISQEAELQKQPQAPAYSAAEEQPIEKPAEGREPVYDLGESAPESREPLMGSKAGETPPPALLAENDAIDQNAGNQERNEKFDWAQFFQTRLGWFITGFEILLVLIAVSFGVLAALAYKSRRL